MPATVSAITPANAERYEDEGFKYHADLGISVQGQSASDAWKEIDRLARKWTIPVTIEFWWRQNDKAQYPGRTGILRSGGADAASTLRLGAWGAALSRWSG